MGNPDLNIEHGGYERGPYEVFHGNYTSPEVCLERAWQCVFAGTYPKHYWQGAAWNVVIPDIDDLPKEDRPRLDFYRHMRTFVDRYQVDRLSPAQNKSNAGFCLHDNYRCGCHFWRVGTRKCTYVQAVGEGFEPPVLFRARRFSRPVHSTRLCHPT